MAIHYRLAKLRMPSRPDFVRFTVRGGGIAQGPLMTVSSIGRRWSQAVDATRHVDARDGVDGRWSKICSRVPRWPRRSCGTAGGARSQFNRVARQLNERSRETLGFETRAERDLMLVLHRPIELTAISARPDRRSSAKTDGSRSMDPLGSRHERAGRPKSAWPFEGRSFAETLAGSGQHGSPR
jgi:hypothetical protein